MASCFLLTPAEVIKQNAQVTDVGKNNKGSDQLKKSGMGISNSNATVQVIKQFRNKPWRLWNGYTALVARNMPATVLNFPIFESLRSNLIEWRRKRKITDTGIKDINAPENANPLLERTLFTGISGGASGSIVAVITTPIDVVKTRLMLAAAATDIGGADAQGKIMHKTWDVGRDVFRNEGIRGLFRGGLIRAGWTSIAMGLYLSMYEGIKFYLERRKNSEGAKNRGGSSS